MPKYLNLFIIKSFILLKYYCFIGILYKSYKIIVKMADN